MKYLASIVVGLLIAGVCLAAGGYTAALAAPVPPACGSCAPQSAPQYSFIPQTTFRPQLSFTQQTYYEDQVVNVPQVVRVPRVQNIPRVDYIPETTFIPQATVFPPVKAPCADFTIQSSFAPAMSYSAGYSARAFAPSCAPRGVGCAPRVISGRSFGASAYASANINFNGGFAPVGAGGFASARGGRFVAGGPGFSGGFAAGGFGAGGTSIAARNTAVTAAPGQAVDVRSGGLRGVLFGTRVRVR